MNNSAELLFEYLRSILYDRPIKKLNTDFIEQDLKDLAEGMMYAANCVDTLTEYSKAISTGDLSVDFPNEYNELCLNIKNLHANLNHLTWQAQRVAEGDYSQHVSYLGEFSVAFNKMIEQLSDRESLLKNEAKKAEERAKLTQTYNDLLLTLTKHRRELILVVDKNTKAVLYCNKADGLSTVEGDIDDQCKNCPYRLSARKEIINYDAENGDDSREIEEPDKNAWYAIHTFHIEWEGTEALVHIVEDITSTKIREETLTDMAYRDIASGLYNRRYFVHGLEEVINSKSEFSLAFIDIDGLKYVNDNFGHQEGDEYIKLITDALTGLFRTEDIIARLGGDEFGVLLKGCSAQTVIDKLDSKYHELYSQNLKPYKVSFSYGAIDVAAGEEAVPEELIKKADDIMYKCKLSHKGTYDSGRE